MNWSWEPFERFECVFIHVPKTGGVSVCDCLFGSLVGHHRVSEFASFPYDWFRFTFVRNPFDRLISAYEWYHHPDRNENDRKFREDTMDIYPSFAEWVLHELPKHLTVEHFRPQSYWLDEPVDFIGRYETLAQGVRYIQDLLCLEKTPLKRLNSSVRKGSYWTHDALHRVMDVYREDFERFRY